MNDNYPVTTARIISAGEMCVSSGHHEFAFVEWGEKNSDLFALIYVSEEDTQGRLLSRIMDASDEGLGKKAAFKPAFQMFYWERKASTRSTELKDTCNSSC